MRGTLTGWSLIEVSVLPRRPCQQWQTENSLVPDVTTRVLTAHVPIPLAEKVDQLAARLDRSRGWIIRQALAAWIEQEEARNRSPLEAPGTLDARHEV